MNDVLSRLASLPQYGLRSCSDHHTHTHQYLLLANMLNHVFVTVTAAAAGVLGPSAEGSTRL
jgi:hypothetical protein